MGSVRRSLYGLVVKGIRCSRKAWAVGVLLGDIFDSMCGNTTACRLRIGVVVGDTKSGLLARGETLLEEFLCFLWHTNWRWCGGLEVFGGGIWSSAILSAAGRLFICVGWNVRAAGE